MESKGLRVRRMGFALRLEWNSRSLQSSQKNTCFRDPSRNWKDPKFRASGLDKLETQLGIEHLEQWHDVSTVQVRELAPGLLQWAGGSLRRLLMERYPHHEWLAWRFRAVPSGFWSIKVHRIEFARWAMNQLQVRSMDDWYKIRCIDIVGLPGGRRWLQHHGDSLATALRSCFPEHLWRPWLFRRASRYFWLRQIQALLLCASPAQRFLMENHVSARLSKRLCIGTHTVSITASEAQPLILWLKRVLHIDHFSDGFRVSREQLRRLHCGSLVRYYGVRLLMQIVTGSFHLYSSRWRCRDKTQQWLTLILCQALTPLHSHSLSDCTLDSFGSFLSVPSVLKNVRIRSMLYEDSRFPMEFDIVIPDLFLAIEFQGVQHFRSHALLTKRIQWRDDEKSEACSRLGITLLQIPYFWDLRPESLLSSIALIRPDLTSRFRSIQ